MDPVFIGSAIALAGWFGIEVWSWGKSKVRQWDAHLLDDAKLHATIVTEVGFIRSSLDRIEAKIESKPEA